jgi:hypothetical protein
VPESAVEGAPQGGTEPLNTSLNRKTVAPDLRVVPTDGWEALKFRAPKLMQDCWLPHIELVSEGVEGIRLRAKESYQANRIRDELKPGGVLHDLAVVVGIDPEKVTIDGPTHAKVPRTLEPVCCIPLTEQGQNEMADRLEAVSSGPIEPMPHTIGPNVSSLVAYRTRQGNLPDTDDHDGT